MALSANRDTREIVGALVQLTVADNKTAYAGGLAAVDAAGKGLPAADAANLKVLGRFEHGAAAGEKVMIKRGTFLFANNTADLVTVADIGGYCYVTDDETVQHTANSNAIIAGVVRGVVADGVYVDTAWYVDGAAAATAGATAGTTAGATAGAAAIAADLADGSSTIKAAALVQGAAAIATDLADGSSTIKAAATTLANGAVAAAGNMRLVDTPPATKDAMGVKGDVAIDATSIYLCTATNTWVKAALAFATWS